MEHADVPPRPDAPDIEAETPRDKAWLPNRSDIRVRVGAAFLPTRTGWGQALELRDAARKWITVTLAEPTLDV